MANTDITTDWVENHQPFLRVSILDDRVDVFCTECERHLQFMLAGEPSKKIIRINRGNQDADHSWVTFDMLRINNLRML